MSANHSPLEELKTRAALLLKDLRTGDHPAADRAAWRLRRATALRAPSTPARMRETARLKHALEAVAREQGFPDWSACKRHFELAPHAVDLQAPRRLTADREGDGPFAPILRGNYLHLWFADYEEADKVRRENGGYLLTYRRQYFVCGEDAIAALGLDPADPDWDLMGRDWAWPGDQAAKARLEGRLDRKLSG